MIAFAAGRGRSIRRYEVPVDSEWCVVCGDPLHVAARQVDVVEFWALHDGGEAARTFRVFGAGDLLPDAAGLVYWGTALAGGGALVWHLVELVSAARVGGVVSAPAGR